MRRSQDPTDYPLNSSILLVLVLDFLTSRRGTEDGDEATRAIVGQRGNYLLVRSSSWSSSSSVCWSAGEKSNRRIDDEFQIGTGQTSC
jgi:hypothetical protein